MPKNTARLLQRLLLAFVFMPALAARGQDTPGFEGLEASKPTRAPGLRGSISLDAPKPAVAPVVTWAVTGRSSRVVAVARNFNVALDTPCFDNFSTRNSAVSTQWSAGTCYGINLLATQWFQTFVIPLATRADASVSNQMGVAGPVHRGNVGSYRLHPFSAPVRRQRALYRAALRYQDDCRYSFNQAVALAPDRLYTRLVRELTNPGAQLAMINIYNVRGDSAHSLLVYRIEEASATSSARTCTTAMKVRFYDPNFPVVNGRNRPEMYLMYFPMARKWAVPQGWLNLYNQKGDLWQQGSYLSDNQLCFAEVNGTVSRISRAIGNWMQGEVARTTQYR